MQVNILIFGQIADIIGTNNILMTDVHDTDDLTNRIKASYPVLNTSKFAVAVDKKIVKENTALNNNNTIALLPPFSGG